MTNSNSSPVAALPKNSIVLNFGEGKPQHTIIWLHGLGATSNDFPPIVPELGLDSGRAIKFVFPQAPNRQITINGGLEMPGWYDVKGLSLEEKQDLDGIRESQTMLEGLIAAEIAEGINPANILIAGFSQGGAVCYYTLTRSQTKLAGLIALSTYLPFAEQTEQQQSSVNIDTPILANHGSHDPVVPISFGLQSADTLKQLGYTVQWQIYPMEHQVVMEQIKDIGRWINQAFQGS